MLSAPAKAPAADRVYLRSTTQLRIRYVLLRRRNLDDSLCRGIPSAFWVKGVNPNSLEAKQASGLARSHCEMRATSNSSSE